jgi:P27 family predicted phage terminase small subunit
VPPALAPLDVAVPAVLEGDALAAAEWQRVAGALAGTVSEAGRGVLILYCATWAQWQRLEADVHALKAPVVKTPTGTLKVHPLIGLARATGLLVLKVAGELGLTPASRSRVAASPVPPAPASKWDGLLP